MSNNSIEIIEKEIKKIYLKTTWSHKIHEKQSEICMRKHKRIETINLSLTSLTSCGLFTAIVSTNIIVNNILIFISVVVSLLNTFFVAYAKKNNLLETESRKNKEIAREYLSLKLKIESVLNDISFGKIKEDTISNERDLIREQYIKIFKDSPQTTDLAVKKAKECLFGEKHFKDIQEEIQYLFEEI